VPELWELSVAELGAAHRTGRPCAAEVARAVLERARPEVSLRLLRLNRLFSYIGVPAITVAIGFDESGLPMAMQLVGRPCAEATLLRVTAAYQSATEWHLRVPPLAAGAAAAAGPSRC
jgi:Asp-tRNA(Asn)/Glu-tRNA(Gln) amidotransferase A subunit family amidase